MKAQYKTTKITGALFLVAMISNPGGGGVLETVLSVPEYLINLISNKFYGDK